MFRFFFGDTRDAPGSDPFGRDGLFGGNSYGESGVDSVFQNIHSDMQQHMEEMQQQMEDMMKNMGVMEFSNIAPVEFPTPDVSGSSNRERNLRDTMLKIEDAPPLSSQIPSDTPDSSFFGGFGLPRLRHTEEPKVDRDLDGRALDVLTELGSPQCTECPVQQESPTNSFVSGQSFSIRSVLGPSGKVERYHTVEDSSGRKEETVTRFVDGKMHSVTRKIDDQCNEEKIEEFRNMDESDLSAFNRNWKNPDVDLQPEHPADNMLMPQPRLNSYLGSLFSKLFGFKPC